MITQRKANEIHVRRKIEAYGTGRFSEGIFTDCSGVFGAIWMVAER